MIITATVTITAPAGEAEDFYSQMNDFLDQVSADYGPDGFTVQVQRGEDVLDDDEDEEEDTHALFEHIMGLRFA